MIEFVLPWPGAVYQMTAKIWVLIMAVWIRPPSEYSEAYPAFYMWAVF